MASAAGRRAAAPWAMRRGGEHLSVALCALAATGCLSCLQKPPVKITGINGKEVTLVPEVNGSLERITWKKNEDIVAEWDEAPWFAHRLKGRAKLNQTSGSLTFKLQQDDAGEYRAEALVAGNEIQCTFFSVQVLEPPSPPQLTCTAINDSIQVSCEPDAQDMTQKTIAAYSWKYQKSKKEILGNSSVIWLEKDVDLSENVTCIISIYNANANSSIHLRSCTPTGAVQQRSRTWLIMAFVLVLPTVLAVIYWRRKGSLNIRRKRHSQHCEDGTGADRMLPEGQRLHKEHSGILEENHREDGNAGARTPPER